MKKRSAVVGLAALLLGPLHSGRATADEIPTPEETIVADEAPPPQAGESTAEEVEEDLLEGWQFELVPYMWIAATSAGSRSASAARASTSRSATSSTFSAASTRAGRWRTSKRETIVSSSSPTASSPPSEPIGRRQVDTDIESLTYLVEFGAAYRFFEYATTLPSKSPIAVDVLAGGRWPTRWRSTRTSTAPTSRSRCR